MPRWLGALVFFGTALAVWGGLNYYVYFRISNGFDLGSKARLVLKIAIVVFALAYVAGRFLESVVGRRGVEPLLWVGAIWMGLLALTVSTLVVFDVWVSLPLWVLRRSAAISPTTAAQVARWGLCSALGLSVVLSGWGAKTALSGPKVTDLRVPISRLPASLEGFTLVAITDLHIGDMVTQGYLDRVIRQVEGLHPDLVVLIGDISDERGGGDGSAFRKLGALKARFGVLGVTGNHEYYSGGEGQVRALESAGMRIVRQGHIVIAEKLVIAGVDDPAFVGGRRGVVEALEKALRGRPEGLPVVLLSHQPLAVHQAAEHGVDLMLSGHTHGGQLPPFQLLSGLAYPFLKGHYEVEGLHLYVSNGAGFWGPPIRVFASPEVVRVTLTSRAP